MSSAPTCNGSHSNLPRYHERCPMLHIGWCRDRENRMEKLFECPKCGWRERVPWHYPE